MSTTTAFQNMQSNAYYRQSPLAVDTHPQKYFEEEDSSILDENILEHNGSLDSGLEMSPPMDDSRRQSFAVSSTMFSPKPEEWQHTVDMQATTSSHGYNNNPFVEQHSNNPFMRLDQQQAANYGQQSFGWPMSNGSGSCTPMQPHDGLPSEFDAMHFRPMPNQTPFSNPATGVVPLFSPATNESMPTSPEKHWMEQNGMDHQGMPKRMRPNSPLLRSHSPLLTMRRDGIRKKNARFDIPAERNLNNIDTLIAQSNNEQEIKELKQQKRLLRNRQAALDSRQRKKQHTERLEDEKKHYTAAISELEEELADMRISMDDLTHAANQKEAQYQHYIESLILEKEEMVRSHTVETGDLRKKVSVLTEHIKQMEHTTMSAVPSSTGFSSADYSDMNNLHMDSDWENISFLEDFTLEHEAKAETSIIPAKKATNAMESDDKPAAHGLLLMLLLCGAFVASRGTTPSIPRMSDDVRAASATILDDIFKDAGVQNNQASASIVEAGAPSTTSTSWPSAPTAILGHNDNMVGVSTSMLGDLADQLSQPTEQQKNEQLFGLSAAQYDGLTSQDFRSSNQNQQTTPPIRRNLAESLAAMRKNSKDSAAEVYTRSLLWDQVPSEVVRNFAKLVAECNPGTTTECDTTA